MYILTGKCANINIFREHLSENRNNVNINHLLKVRNGFTSHYF